MAGDDEQKVIEHKKGSSAASAPWENPNHQLYMHHSDQLIGMILVPQTLTEDNYID